MKIPVDVWLRGNDFATTVSIEGPVRQPAAWTHDDVRLVIGRMLQAMDRLKNPGEEERAIAFKGLSWIVNPYDAGGVVIAIEIMLGAVIAGPVDIDKTSLDTMIRQVVAPGLPTPSIKVH